MLSADAAPSLKAAPALRWWREWEIPALVVLVLAGYFLRVGSLPLRGEESTRALIASEMVQSGDWIVPRRARGGISYSASLSELGHRRHLPCIALLERRRGSFPLRCCHAPDNVGDLRLLPRAALPPRRVRLRVRIRHHGGHFQDGALCRNGSAVHFFGQLFTPHMALGLSAAVAGYGGFRT